MLGHLVDVDDVEVGEVGVPKVAEVIVDFDLISVTTEKMPAADGINKSV